MRKNMKKHENDKNLRKRIKTCTDVVIHDKTGDNV